MKNNNFKHQLMWFVMLLTGLWTTNLFAQQRSGSHVSSYNFTQTSTTFFEQNGVVAPFKTTLATGAAAFTSTSNAFLLPTGFTYTINGTAYVGTGAGFTGNAFVINSNGWIGFNNNGTVNSITSVAATVTSPLTSTTVQPASNGLAGTATNQGNGALFCAMGRAMVANAAGANGIANGSECYVVTYGDGRIVVEWRNMKPSSTVTGRIDYEFIIYPDNYLGGGLKAKVEYRYANISFTGTASSAQVGVRGWQGAADAQLRQTTTDWSASVLGSGDATNPAPATGTMTLSATIFPVTGLSYTYTPCTAAASYASLPFSEGFEGTWTNLACGSGITQDIVTTNWRSGPTMGNMSWRRQDAGATGYWSNLASGVPAATPFGLSYAKFHTYAGSLTSTWIGVMDLYANVATGAATLNFSEINTSGSDVLRVRVSTDGGVTFPTLAATIALNAAWTAVAPISISGSATTVIRFEASSDFGTTDIGIDNISLTPVVTPPNCATTFFPVNGATSVCKNLTLTWVSGGGGPSGYKLTFGTNSPNYDNIVNNVNLGNVLSYNAGSLASSTTYGWKIVPTNVNGDAVGCTFNTFTTGTVVCYCSTSYANGTGSGDYISQVTVPPTTLNNLTVGAGTPYYTLYPQSGSTTGSFAQGTAYVMTVKGGTFGTCFIRGWIDYDQDGNFTTGETIGISPNVGASTAGTISFTIPGGATLGTARLRLRSSDTSPGPSTAQFCAATNSGYGETEDYDITIITPPAPSVSTFNPAAACGASSVIISGSDFTGATAVTFGGTPAQSFVVNNANQITAVVSNSGSSGVISVTSPNGTGSSGASFTFNGVGPVVSIQEGASFTKCAGQSQTLTALPTGGGETYAWSTSETTQAISVSSAGSYTVTVTNTGGCTNTTSAALTVIPLPSGVTANASTSSVCDGSPFNLTSTGTTTGTGTILSEGFESGAPGWSFQDSSSTGAALAQQVWHIQNAPYTDPSGSITFNNFSVTGTKFAYTNADAGGSGSQTRTFMTSPAFSTAAFSGTGTLSFKMCYKFWSSSSPAEQVMVQISTDGGATWAATLANYSPTNTGPDVGTTTSNAEVAVTVNVSVPAIYMGQSNVKLRWRYLSNWGYVWIVDDVLLTATPLPTFSWTSSPAGFTSGVQNPTGVTQSVDRTYTVVATGEGGCTASATTATINTLARPTAALSGTTTLCNGQTTSLTVAVTGLSGINGTINPGSIPFSGTAGNITVPVSPTSNTTYTLALPLTDANCSAIAGDLSGSAVITVNARPTGALSGTTTICPGGTATLSIAATGSGTISGTLSPGAIPYSGTAPTITVNVTPGAMTSYSINTMADANCSSDPGDLSGGATVSIYTTATAPGSVTSDDANNEICAGQQIMLTANGGAFGNAPGSTYKWYEGGCGTGPALGSLSTLSVTPSVGSHTYYVRIEDACGNSSCASLVVLVSSGPPTNSVGTPVTPSEACNGTVSLVSVNSVGGPNVKYSWNTGTNSSVVLFSTNIGGPFSPGPFLTTTNSVYAQFGALAGSSGYNICVQGTNACGSTNNKCDWIRGVVGVPGTITPPAGVVACANDVKNYSCGASGGATVYNWTLGGSATPITSGQGTTNVSVTFPPAFTTAQLCVTASLSCGGSSTSAPRCMTVSKTPAVPGAFTAGPSAVCPGATGVTFTIPAVTGASGYTWTTPAGTTIAGGQNSTSITVNFPNPYTGAPPVCVTANSACASSVGRCKTVGSNLPGQPGAMSGPTTNVCNSTVQYSISNVTGATNYTWTNPAGTTITSGQTTTTILLSVSPSFVSGQLTVVANTNACTPGTSIPRTITINGKPNVPGTITASPAVWCTGGFVNFSVTTVSPLPTYNWSVSNGTITAGQGSSNIDVTWGATASGTVTVNASNGCGASSNRSQSFSAGCREEGDQLPVTGNQLSVYPNPAHDKVTVSIDVKEASPLNLQLRDMSGRVILSEDRESDAGLNTYEIELKNFAKGIYTLEMQSGTENLKTKVVIE